MKTLYTNYYRIGPDNYAAELLDTSGRVLAYEADYPTMATARQRARELLETHQKKERDDTEPAATS